MPRSRREWTEEKYHQYLKEGRGKGTKEQYIPWIKVGDFSSKGRVSRVKGWKTGRLHHLLSDHEARLFYLLEWSDIVVDIREQFPLLDLDLAHKISADIGVKYPIDSQSKSPKILTTDFMVTISHHNKTRDIALTVKPSSELVKKRVIEKFEIERNYFIAQGIEWGIVTEKHIPKTLARNIEWIHGTYNLEAMPLMSVEELRALIPALKQRLLVPDLKISQAACNLDRELGLVEGTSLYLFMHLVARKEIILDMDSSKNVPDRLVKDIQKIIPGDILERAKTA